MKEAKIEIKLELKNDIKSGESKGKDDANILTMSEDSKSDKKSEDVKTDSNMASTIINARAP